MHRFDRTPRHLVGRTAVALLCTALLAGCLGDDAGSNDPAINDPNLIDPENPDATAAPEDPVDAEAAGNDDPSADDGTLGDGDHAGRVRHLDATSVTVEVVHVLSGEEAVAAAEADGMDVGDGLPNDVYVRDAGDTFVMELDPDAEVRVVDCRAGCELVEATVADLAAGRAELYGGDAAVVDLVVEQGRVVSLSEVYLP